MFIQQKEKELLQYDLILMELLRNGKMMKRLGNRKLLFYVEDSIRKRRIEIGRHAKYLSISIFP